MYKTELHIHTGVVSKCGRVSAREIVKLYKDLGFETIFITEHINKPSFDMRSEAKESWEEKVDMFFDGYLAAKRAGDELGLRVLFGAEICFKEPMGNVNDYLVYGIDRDFLLGYEYLHHGSIEEFYKYAKERGAIVIQAHPYRETPNYGDCYPTPDFVDGFELINGHRRHRNNNGKTAALVDGRDFLLTAGSDFHMVGDEASAYIETEEPIRSAEDLIRVLRERSAVLTAKSHCD